MKSCVGRASKVLFIPLIFSCLSVLFEQPVHATDTTALEASLKQKPDNLALRVKLAGIYADDNKPEKTIELLNPYTDQLNANGFMLLASSYSKRNDFANEVRILNFLTNKEDGNYRWHMLLGQAYLKQASDAKVDDRKQDLMTSGIQQLRRTLKLNKKYKPAFDLLLNTFMLQRANNEAREMLMEGINIFGHRPELFRELCRMDSQDAFLVQAVTNCSESINLEPNYPDHYVYLVQALHDQKEDQRAERQIVSAARKFPKSEFVQWAAGEVFFRKKNFPVAARYYEAAANSKPDSGRAQFGLAQALFESGEEARALEPFKKACKLEPSSQDTFLSATGRVKQKIGGELASKYSQASGSCR